VRKYPGLLKTLRFILVFAGCLFSLYPLMWMLASSFKPEAQIFSDKSLIIHEFTFSHYLTGLQGMGGTTFLDNFRNTFAIVIPVVIGNVLSCSMTGYAFARLSFVWKRVFFALMILTMMLPMHAALIPRYILFNNMHWVNTFLPLIVPSYFAVSAFFCFLNVQFMRGIPMELDQAATIDGCSPVGIYARILLPLSLPAILTTAIFSFIWTYDDFFSQLIYLGDPKKYTVALALRQYVEATGESSYGRLFAMSVVSMIPVFVFFVTCQKYLIQGIATTGLKG
jgi:multiple sugar transport system permease protein